MRRIFIAGLLILGLALIFGSAPPRAQMLQDIAQDVHHTSSPGCTGALDSLPTPLSGYSTRLLKGTYTGFAFQLERASDSTTHDIGFVSCNLDTSTISTFCNATTCAFSKWYDQYANMDWSQATAANQPPYNSTCGTNLNSKPCAAMTGTSCMLGVNAKIDMTGDQSVFFVSNTGNNTAFAYMNDQETSSPFLGYGYDNGNNVAAFDQGLWNNTKGIWQQGLTITNANHVAGWIRSAGSVTFYQDASTSAAITGMGNSASGVAPQLFADSSACGHALTGDVAEVIFVNSAWSSANFSTYRTGTQSWFATP